MASFAGLQTFRADGSLSFDSTRKWARALDYVDLSKLTTSGSKDYPVAFGKVVISPFISYWTSGSTAQREPFWIITNSDGHVEWEYNPEFSGSTDPRNKSFLYVLWID